jgi:hypothetical protein
MEGPPIFVAGSGVPRDAWWGMEQIPPCSLRSLVGMTRILCCARLLEWPRFFVYARGWCRSVRIVTASKSQNPHFSQNQGEVGHPQDKRALQTFFARLSSE